MKNIDKYLSLTSGALNLNTIWLRNLLVASRLPLSGFPLVKVFHVDSEECPRSNLIDSGFCANEPMGFFTQSTLSSHQLVLTSRPRVRALIICRLQLKERQRERSCIPACCSGHQQQQFPRAVEPVFVWQSGSEDVHITSVPCCIVFLFQLRYQIYKISGPGTGCLLWQSSLLLPFFHLYLLSHGPTGDQHRYSSKRCQRDIAWESMMIIFMAEYSTYIEI